MIRESLYVLSLKKGLFAVILNGGIAMAGTEVIMRDTSPSEILEIVKVICAMIGTITASYFSYLIVVNQKKSKNEEK